MNVIGLGQAGCNIAEKFKEHPQYKVFKIDAKLKKAKGVYALKHQDTPELYEAKFPSLRKTFLKEVIGDVLFITSCGAVSGASLRLLEQLKDKCNISILYIKPDTNILSRDKSLQNNLLFNVFQEMARSALFERVYLIDNPKVADIIGDIPIAEYYDQINRLIVSAIHMINVFNNSEPMMDTSSEPIPTARISTIGIVDMGSEEENLFFDLDMSREKRYYYAIPKEKIESDGKLIKKIKKQVKNNLEHDKMKNSYAIYSTTYEDVYIYCIANSTLVQKNKKIA